MVRMVPRQRLRMAAIGDSLTTGFFLSSQSARLHVCSVPPAVVGCSIPLARFLLCLPVSTTRDSQ